MIEIETLRKRAIKFAKDFEQTTSEKRNDQNFMRGLLCDIFEISSNRIEWQYPVKEHKTTRFIDGLLLGTLLIEMKTAGKDLDEAYLQAINYVSLIEEKHRPHYILVSDFQNLHLYDRLTGEPRVEIKLAELPQQIEFFRFLEGYQIAAIKKQEHINKAAAEKMAGLHDAIKATGYTGKDLETYLVRLLFCLFADSTGLFGENNQFLNYLLHYTKTDGSDLHGALSKLFDTLNTPDAEYLARNLAYRGKKRLTNLPEHLNKFTYINGLLFNGILGECYFDEAARNTLIECAQLDWSEIS
ncbi:MAG: putative adenine-specific methylase, partial [Pseudomonadota bacterium]